MSPPLSRPLLTFKVANHCWDVVHSAEPEVCTSSSATDAHCTGRVARRKPSYRLVMASIEVRIDCGTQQRRKQSDSDCVRCRSGRACWKVHGVTRTVGTEAGMEGLFVGHGQSIRTQTLSTAYSDISTKPGRSRRQLLSFDESQESIIPRTPSTTMASPAHPYTIHALTSADSDTRLTQILDLSSQIFASHPSNPETHTSLAYWRSRLCLPHAHILYAASECSEVPVGFVFNFPKTHADIGIETLHVWLAGVVEEARGQGVFGTLMEETRRRAREAGFQWLSIATIPERFGRMWDVLRAEGWEVVKWEDGTGGRKVVMKLLV